MHIHTAVFKLTKKKEVSVETTVTVLVKMRL
jgi:hypothetical protein